MEEMLAWVGILELAKEMVKEAKEVALRKTSHKNKNMMTVVMVALIKVMKRRILLMRKPAIAGKKNNNNVGHYTRK